MRLPRRAELSEEQEDFLMEAPYNKPVLCVGPPGTGKTVLALYRCATLNQLGQGSDLIMFSKLLKHYVERSISELKLDVDTRTWHSWVYSLWKKGKCSKSWNMPQVERFSYDFMTAMELVTNKQLRSPQDLYWENLVIDEGQDFPKEFYLFLTFLRRNEAVLAGRNPPSLTIFADDNQRMEENQNSTTRDIEAYVSGISKYKINLNYRNSGPIAKLANYFCIGLDSGKSVLAKNVNGLRPELRRYSTLDEEAKSIISWLKNNDDLSVGVITPSRAIQRKMAMALEKYAIQRDFRVQSYNSSDRDSLNKINFYEPRTILVVCDKSCKGLEFDGVFIPQLHHYNVDGVEEDFFKMKMYVMVSRARKYLRMSFSECEGTPNITNILPSQEKGLLNWKI